MRAVKDHRLSLWDAMLWAAAKRAGCRLLFSEDLQDGRHVEGVLFIDPSAPENRGWWISRCPSPRHRNAAWHQAAAGRAAETVAPPFLVPRNRVRDRRLQACACVCDHPTTPELRMRLSAS
jgi:hypothetical protein